MTREQVKEIYNRNETTEKAFEELRREMLKLLKSGEINREEAEQIIKWSNLEEIRKMTA